MRRTTIAGAVLAMSLLLALLALLAATSPPLTAQRGAPAVDVQTLEANWVRALLATDMNALDAMFSDDLIYIHSSGGTQDKKAYLDSIRTGSLRYKTMTPVGSPRVRSFGNTAIVSSRYDMNLETGGAGRVTPYTIQYLTVYVNESGTWRIVAQQTTSVPKRP